MMKTSPWKCPSAFSRFQGRGRSVVDALCMGDIGGPNVCIAPPPPVLTDICSGSVGERRDLNLTTIQRSIESGRTA